MIWNIFSIPGKNPENPKMAQMKAIAAQITVILREVIDYQLINQYYLKLYDSQLILC